VCDFLCSFDGFLAGPFFVLREMTNFRVTGSLSTTCAILTLFNSSIWEDCEDEKKIEMLIIRDCKESGNEMGNNARSCLVSWPRVRNGRRPIGDFEEWI
jgi:hypothetical protein